MLACEAAFVFDNRPDLFIGEQIAKSNHRGPSGAVFDHPENLPFRPMAPESMMLEISWRGIE
jgi:hypothetical protein